VSDPTCGPRTLTPGPVRGSLTSRLLAIGTARICRMESAAIAQLICGARNADQRRWKFA
jgi:hypothetical protein